MLALVNTSMFSGKADRLENGITVLIKDDRIEAAGRDLPLPEGVHVLDLTGHFLIPGLIDAHTHLGSSSSPERQANAGRFATYDYGQNCSCALAWGVTTVRSAGDYTPDIFEFRDAVDRGEIVAPRVLAAGRVFQAKDGHPGHTVYFSHPDILSHVCIEVTDSTDIDFEVSRLVKEGADWIKAFISDDDKMNCGREIPRLSNAQLRHIVEAAHRWGKPVMMHTDDIGDMRDAALAGADTIEHTINTGTTDHEMTDELLDILTARGTWVVPTMIATKCFDDLDPSAPHVFPALQKAVGRMVEAGVRLGVGCDSGIPFVPYGECEHLELELLVNAGMTPATVLRAATFGNAEMLGIGHICGTIAPGLAADLVVLGKNPLADIRNTRDIRLVLRDGKVVVDRMLSGEKDFQI